MKKIFSILLFVTRIVSFGHNLPSKTPDSTIRFRFDLVIPAPGLSTPVLYNKVVDWFSSHVANSVGEVTIAGNQPVCFSSTGQNELIIPSKTHPYSVRYKLLVLLGEERAQLLIKDFTFFRKPAGPGRRRQSKEIILLMNLHCSPSKPVRLEKAVHQLADSLADRFSLTLRQAFK